MGVTGVVPGLPALQPPSNPNAAVLALVAAIGSGPFASHGGLRPRQPCTGGRNRGPSCPACPSPSVALEAPSGLRTGCEHWAGVSTMGRATHTQTCISMHMRVLGGGGGMANFISDSSSGLSLLDVAMCV